MNVSNKNFYKDFISLNILYKDLSYLLISDVPQQNWINFIAALGSLLGGSFVGMSLLSFVELFEILFRLLCIIFSKIFKNFYFLFLILYTLRKRNFV